MEPEGSLPHSQATYTEIYKKVKVLRKKKYFSVELFYEIMKFW